MVFYKITMTINAISGEKADRLDEMSRRAAARELGKLLAVVIESFSDKISDKGSFFLSESSMDDCIFGMVLRRNLDVEKLIADFIRISRIDAQDIEIREITLSEFADKLRASERNGYVTDEYDILREYDLTGLVGFGPRGRRLDYDEIIFREREKDAIYLTAQGYFVKDTLNPELDRIFSGKIRRKAYGHPVDYMIESDDKRTKDGATHLLLAALHNVGRIENRRYCELRLRPDDEDYSTKSVDLLYRTCVGGTMVLDFCGEEQEDDDKACGEYYYMEDMCKIIRRHCCDVLTIVCFPRECTKIKRHFLENMGDCTFIGIREELVADELAEAYLRQRAKEYKVRTDKNLLSKVERGHGYLADELNVFFDEWYNKKLKTSIFSQYKGIDGIKTEIMTKKPKGSAYKELESMIGLKSAKTVLHQALDHYKAQKMFKNKGISEDPVCNHMIFTGNPGTAKTTVARLFARILKDNDVLSKGHIVEVGRSDLVGRFVGWTAPLVRNKFNQAVGGILFIDEAYSLVDDRDGLYGDEAINTIVQEMENHKDELIVIFAGYPDKMEGFLDKNPGLRSRIAHYVHFEDYSTDELCRIAEHIAAQKGMVIDPAAGEKIRAVMENARGQADFGNGRYVRNVIEKARMVQSGRLVNMDYASVTSDDIKTILAEDIVMPETGHRKEIVRIGFVS